MKVIFRRQVYSNSSTGLEKSAQDVWNTPPNSPIFGALIPLLMVSWEKKFLPSKKYFLEDGVNYSHLDPQLVVSRETGHFQTCFPSTRPVNRSVFEYEVQGQNPRDETGQEFVPPRTKQGKT